MLKPSTTAALLVALVSALVPASGSAYIPRPPIASADEAEGPKTRVRGINSAAGTCVGAEEPQAWNCTVEFARRGWERRQDFLFTPMEIR
jgi:hypothetical protein